MTPPRGRDPNGPSADNGWLHDRMASMEAEQRSTTNRIAELSTLVQVDLARTKGEIQRVGERTSQSELEVDALFSRTSAQGERLSKVEEHALSAKKKAEETSARLQQLAMTVIVAVIAAGLKLVLG